MPQMAPINWLSLFIMFSLTLIIFNMMNFYMYIPNMPKLNLLNNNEKFLFKLNWKW